MLAKDYHILIVDDEAEYTVILKKILHLEGFSIDTVLSAEEAIHAMKTRKYNLVLTDLMMDSMNGMELLEYLKQSYSDTMVILMTAYATIDNAVEAMKKGADSYFVKGNDPHDLITEIVGIYETKKIKAMHPVKTAEKSFLPTSKNPAYRAALEIAKKAAQSNASILLLGESGVGKEVFARYIHNESRRSKQDFVAVNCHAIQENILESELFGHCKGAFTGATSDRIGKFEKANQGTLFLDEIADAPLSTQIKLLRVLDLKQIERLGSNELIKVDFRLISATNKDLNKLMVDELFREDFYYRISPIVIDIPPLRERPEDLEDLIHYFVRHSAQEINIEPPKMPLDVMLVLKNYPYPGNIRELKNVIERLVVLSSQGIVSASHLPARIWEEKSIPKDLRSYRQLIERQHIQKILIENDYKVGVTSEVLGISRRQLSNKMTEYKLR